VSEILTPARDEATAILRRGRRAGVFHDRLPAEVLSAALEALTLSLLESVNTGAWQDDGTRTAVATLVAAGVPAEAATATVEDVAAQMRAEASEGRHGLSPVLSGHAPDLAAPAHRIARPGRR
jgi:hypothetical protein